MMVGYASPEERSRVVVWEPVCARDARESASETVKREVNQEGWPGRRRGTARGTEKRGERGGSGGKERVDDGGVVARRRRRANPRRGRREREETRRGGRVLGINGRNPAGHYTLSDTT